jgi:MYXO-CTERM domain-containing protein
VPSDAGAESPPYPDDKVPPDGGTDLLPPDGQCTCTPSGVKACKLTVVGCSTSSDCASGFTCEENPSGTCWASSDGQTGCDTPDPAKICAPPYTDLLNGAGRSLDSSGENGGSTTGTGAPEPPKSGGPADAGDVPASGNSAPAADGGETVVTHGGCSLASGPTTNGMGYGLVALGLAGLFGARRRRR